MASTSTLTHQDALDSQYLSSSISNMSRSRTTNTLIVRTYKQATQLYLTRRFKEALDTLEPIVTPLSSHPDALDGQTNGDPATSNAAAVAQSSKGTRTKVWVFYLSLIHAIIELGPEEGKLLFGSTKWRELAAKARDGSVWDEVVQRGYGGSEGDVDADVVQNLSTLLLGHMQNQQLNQQRLESWLANSADRGPHVSFEGLGTPLPSGASTPKVLNTRLKVLELYALHVLPANDEWDLARDFIEMNDTLDEERKEAFQQALETLKEEKNGAALREAALKEQREREMEAQRQQEEEARRAEQLRLEEERKKAADAEKNRAANHSQPSRAASNGMARPGPSNKPSAKSSSSKSTKKPRAAPSPNLYSRASTVLAGLQTMIMKASQNMRGNPMALLRAVMFLLAFLLIAARRDLRERIKRALDDGWGRVKRTVGMGVKVSYL